MKIIEQANKSLFLLRERGEKIDLDLLDHKRDEENRKL